MLSETEKQEKLASRLKDFRVLVVINLLNGVPEWQVAKSFQMEVSQVHAVFSHAMKKVKDYLFRHCKPPIFCDTLKDAKANRVNIMAILPKLNLDIEPIFPKIALENVTSGNIEGAIHDLRR